MTTVPLYGPPQTVTVREFPMRRLNARMWGHVKGGGERATSDPVKLGGCGRVCEGGSWVPVFDVDTSWRPGSVATCNNALLCDFCGPRKQAESAARFGWHFEDWLNGGGQLLHIRLSVPHRSGDDLAALLEGLKDAEAGLRRSSAWKRAGIVDWVRVLHLRWSPATGFHPHYHVTAFVPAGRPLDEAATVLELQAAWRDRVARAGFKRSSRRHGLFARVVAGVSRALYAWSWSDEDEDQEDDDDDRYHPMADASDGDDDRYHPSSMSLSAVAVAALDGDQRAWAVWAEACRALKGVPIVKASRMLDRLWAAHEAEAAPEPEVELGDPVVLVGSTLWERARRDGVTQMGLAVGREFGVDAMAQWWATQLGARVRVEGRAGSTPRVALSVPSG